MREHRDNLRAAAKMQRVDQGAFDAVLARALEAYAAAHEALRPLNAAQDLARDAAVHLARLELDACAKKLEALRELCLGDERWSAAAGRLDAERLR